MTEKRVEEILCKSMPRLSPKEELNQQILERADVKKRRGFHGKRLAAVAAACLLLISSVTVGAATICYIYTVARLEEFYTEDYRKISVVEEKSGYDINFVEEFENGFTFESAAVRKDTQHAMDKSQELVYAEEMTFVDIWYSREDAGVMLSCYKREGELTAGKEGEVWNIAGKDVIYEYITLDDEALTALITPTDAAGEAKVVPVEDFSYMTAIWLQNDVCHHFMAISEYVTKEEFFAMVEELILSE